MRLRSVHVANFRLLQSVQFDVEGTTTVIVGRNNAGKTSLTELFRRISGGGAPSFNLEDFSNAAHRSLWNAYELFRAEGDEVDVHSLLPNIVVRLTVSYDLASTELGRLAEFIIDLDATCSDAILEIRYSLDIADVQAFLQDIEDDGMATLSERQARFCREAGHRLPTCYVSKLFAIDPTDETNDRELAFAALHSVIRCDFINAQRGLDDVTHKEINLLGKVLEKLLSSASSDTASETDQIVAQTLSAAVENIQVTLDGSFKTQLEKLWPTFSLFGYPGLNDPRLVTETLLNTSKILQNHTTVRYAGLNGVNLPEAYNGLGVRNLIYILLHLYSFFRGGQEAANGSMVHVVFIEEPEVHLHPQMQEVFIDRLAAIKRSFGEAYNGGVDWAAQFIVTTHSPHVANKADFEAIRYFTCKSGAATSSGVPRTTTIKDLRKGLGASPAEDREFLHKYLTLTRCDLLFADKAILIEGATERILMPVFLQKTDEARPITRKLRSQYLSVIEVGGAYAHLFFPLLEFLELPTLIITDLDTITATRSSCKVSEGVTSSNACINSWFPGAASRDDLLSKPDAAKVVGSRRLAYQIPEANQQPCGRSFEAAFMLANPNLFGLVAGAAPGDLETSVWDQAKKVDKTEFALKYAILEHGWTVPRYVKDGLEWLSEQAIPFDLEVVLPGIAEAIDA